MSHGTKRFARAGGRLLLMIVLIGSWARMTSAQVLRDANCDGAVDDADRAAIVAALFTSTVPSCRSADVNRDGVISAADLIAFATGPRVAYIGIASPDGRPAASLGTLEDGTPVFFRNAGFGFLLVIEAGPPPDGATVGTSVFDSAADDPRRRPDLQIVSDRQLGDGSPEVCDEFGIPAVDPLDFAYTSRTSNAINDLACRFEVATRRSTACTQDGFGQPTFLAPATRVQFCLPVTAQMAFPTGDTRVSVQIRDTTGMIGPLQQMVLRVGTGAVPPTFTPRPPPATPTETDTPLPTATDTATRATPTPLVTATASTTTAATATIAPTTTAAPSVSPSPTNSRTRTPIGTPTRTVSAITTVPTTVALTSTPTPTASSLVRSSPTITVTPSRTPSGASATPTRTVTATVTRTGTGATPTRTATGATATRSATAATPTPTGPTPTRTRTATLTPTRATPTPARTATPTLTPTTAGTDRGPVITFLGLTRADDALLQPVGMAGTTPIYRPLFGYGFSIVVEAKPGASGATVSATASTFNPGGTPDLQIEVTRPLGNGSTIVCDNQPPILGGVPATNPPSFADDPTITDRLNDLGCRFIDGGGKTQARGCDTVTSCVLGTDGQFGCVAGDSKVQFCGFMGQILAFPSGDTTVTVRVRDTRGNPGPPRQIIVRVP